MLGVICFLHLRKFLFRHVLFMTYLKTWRTYQGSPPVHFSCYLPYECLWLCPSCPPHSISGSLHPGNSCDVSQKPKGVRWQHSIGFTLFPFTRLSLSSILFVQCIAIPYSIYCFGWKGKPCQEAKVFCLFLFSFYFVFDLFLTLKLKILAYLFS